MSVFIVWREIQPWLVGWLLLFFVASVTTTLLFFKEQRYDYNDSYCQFRRQQQKQLLCISVSNLQL